MLRAATIYQILALFALISMVAACAGLRQNEVSYLPMYERIDSSMSGLYAVSSSQACDPEKLIAARRARTFVAEREVDDLLSHARDVDGRGEPIRAMQLRFMARTIKVLINLLRAHDDLVKRTGACAVKVDSATLDEDLLEPFDGQDDLKQEF